jgi:hypothetical protein
LSWGCQAGIWAAFYTLIEILVLFITEMVWPVQEIDIGQSFNKDQYQRNPLSYGDHKLKVRETTTIPENS